MIIRRMAVAVCAMDSLTGQIIEDGSVRIFMQDGAAGIRKEKGFMIFWDNDMASRILIIESQIYEREEITLTMAEFRKKRMPRLLVWLKPGRDYPYPAAVRLATRQGQPGTTERIFLEPSAGVVRLTAAYPADRLYPCLIELRVPTGIFVEGRLLRIYRISDGHWEDFRIWQVRNESAGLYELEQPLQEIYSTYDEKIGFVLELKVGEDGNYQVPLIDS